MEALLYFAVWAGFFFLMMRFGCGQHITGHSAGQTGSKSAVADAQEFRWVPPKTDSDPVCGKTVKTDKARPSVHAGRVYYFCSRECREVFEAAPDLYLGGGDSNHPKLEHSHA